jgi:hypothetical protein
MIPDAQGLYLIQLLDLPIPVVLAGTLPLTIALLTASISQFYFTKDILLHPNPLPILTPPRTCDYVIGNSHKYNKSRL